MERRYRVWEKEKKRDVKTLGEKNYTRSSKKDSLTELHLSAITDHVAKNTIDWEGIKFPTSDNDWTTRVVKEAVKIRKTAAHSMNRDKGRHQGVKFPANDTDWTARGVKGAVEIRKKDVHTINRDGGHHQLPLFYSKLLEKNMLPFVTNITVHQH